MKYIYLIIPLFTFIFIQVVKAAYAKYTSGNALQRLFYYGGMPSAHTGAVVSLATVLGNQLGIDSPAFAITVLFGLLVIIDAVGLRRMLSENSDVLANVASKFPDLRQPNKIYLHFGHSPLQALIGGTIGFIVASISISILT